MSSKPSCITRLLPEPMSGLPAATSGVDPSCTHGFLNFQGLPPQDSTHQREYASGDFDMCSLRWE